MAKFLPTTTQTPMQVGNTGDSYDKMLEIVGGLIKQRKQAKDDEYTAKQREFQLGQQQRTLQEQEAEDIQKMNQQNIANLINTSSPLKFTKEQIAQEMASGNLTKQQAEIMLPKATDYISESDAMNTVLDALSLKPSMTDQEVISTAAEVGIEPRVALSLKDRVNQQILDAQPKGKTGGETGGGDKRGTVGEGKGINTKKAYESSGVMHNSYNVKKVGTDAEPTMVIQHDKVQIHKSRNGYVAVWRDSRGNRKEAKLIPSKDRKKWTASIPGNNKIPEAAIKALDAAYSDYEQAVIDMKGASTGFNNRFTEQ